MFLFSDLPQEGHFALLPKCKGMSFYSAIDLLYDSQPINESTDSLNIPWTKGSEEVSENDPGAVHGGSLD